MISISYAYQDIPGNYRADNEFSILCIPIRTCELIIDSFRWTASGADRTALKIRPILNGERTMSLLKLHRNALGVVVDVITDDVIITSLVGLRRFASDFCRSCSDEEEKEVVSHLLGTCPVLCQRRCKYLDTYYINDLEEPSGSDIGSLNRFIRNCEWFQD